MHYFNTALCVNEFGKHCLKYFLGHALKKIFSFQYSHCYLSFFNKSSQGFNALINNECSIIATIFCVNNRCFL